MIIRPAREDDWPRIHPFFAAIVADGRTYALPEGLSLEEARPWWMEQPPGVTVVAVEGDAILGSAKMGANRPGRGSHVATGSVMVDPRHQACGVGRALGQHVVDPGAGRRLPRHPVQRGRRDERRRRRAVAVAGLRDPHHRARCLRSPRRRPRRPAHDVPAPVGRVSACRPAA